MALKPATTLFSDLTAYEGTYIGVAQAIISSGNYAPGPLILSLAKDATDAIMTELGFELPVAGVDYNPQPADWKVWGPQVGK